MLRPRGKNDDSAGKIKEHPKQTVLSIYFYTWNPWEEIHTFNILVKLVVPMHIKKRNAGFRQIPRKISDFAVTWDRSEALLNVPPTVVTEGFLGSSCFTFWLESLKLLKKCLLEDQPESDLKPGEL